MNPLQAWKAKNIDARVDAIVKAVDKISVECEWCEGTGRDQDFKDFDGGLERCGFCQGVGSREMGPALRRRILNKRLKAAGFNPEAFDDFGNVLPL